MADAPQNHLIELLPKTRQRALVAQCERVSLTMGEVLCEAGAPMRHAYFPVSSFISLLTRIEAHPSLEVGMVGREGCFGATLALGVDGSALQAIVQGPGSAWRISAPALREQLKQSPVLQQLLLRYVHVVMAQMVSASACLRFHPIGPRLARWLLMSEDRAHSKQFRVTQEFLATMLGVRRVGVTAAAGELQRLGLIHYHRGELTVVDRAGLEASACPCYARQQQVYAEQIDGAPAVSPAR